MRPFFPALLVSAVVLGSSPVVARLQSAGSPATKSDGGASARAARLVGAWSLNKDLSDQPQAGDGRGGGDGEGTGVRGRRGGGFGRGGGGRGGRFGGAAAGADPQQAERLRQAMRDLMNPPEHLTIVTAGSMMILTGPDGRTTRLAPDGTKIKEENTNLERKTKWDGDKLVSEISGLGGAKITETYVVDAEHHQLRITTAVEGGRAGAARTISHVYDRDSS